MHAVQDVLLDLQGDGHHDTAPAVAPAQPARRAPLVPVAEHLSRVLAVVTPLPAERVPLARAAGRVLAADVRAVAAVPPWDSSAMDGYAVRHADVARACADTPVTLEVVADLPAGSPLDPVLGPGQAVRIMTGAVLPSTADTVVRMEDTDRTDPFAPLARTVTVRRPPALAQDVRLSGEDRRVGDLVAPAGRRAGTAVLAALAATGHGTVLTSRRPRVAVLTTGSELVAPGAPLHRGLVPDSDGVLVAGLVADAGGTVVARARLHDDPAVLARALDRARGCDVVLVTGGVSAGAFDPVKQLFRGSSEVIFTRVAMQPGKPQAFGRLADGALLFGLPGNPVAAWVSFHAFVRPALLALQGATAVRPALLTARAGTGWVSPHGRTQLVPARVVADTLGWTAHPAAALGSAAHAVGSLAAADGYVQVPPERTAVRAGEPVDAVVLGPA